MMKSNFRAIYEDLVKKHASALYRFAYRLCGDHHVAEDLVQETFYQAWRSIASLKSPEVGKPWLNQILRHRYSHWVRRSCRHPEQVIDPDKMTSFSADIVVDEVRDPDAPLQKALDALNSDFRRIFLMVFLDGWSCREVAEKLDLPLGTVLSRIHRSRIFLRQFIKAYLDRNEIRQSHLNRWSQSESGA